MNANKSNEKLKLRAMEKRIQELEQYQILFENSSDIVLVIGEDGQILKANETAVVTYGYSKEELLTLNISQMGLVNSDTGIIAAKILQGTPMGKKFKTVHQSKDGNILFVEIHVKEAVLDNQKVFINVIRNSNYKEYLLTKAFQLSPIPMFLSASQGNDFLEVNGAFVQLLGLPKKEVIGRTSLNIGVWVKQEDRINFLKKLRKDKQVFNYETVIKSVDKEMKSSLISAVLIEFDERDYIIGIINDVTEKKDLENELVKLEKFNILAEMAASISHEVRNPMTTVRGYLQLLRKKEEKCSHYIETFNLMIDELDRANQLITEFLNITKIKERKKEITSLNEMIKTLLPLLQAEALGRDKFIKTELGDIPNIYLDEQEIRQVIINLVKNGLDATIDNGYVTIKTSCEDEEIILKVQDQGREIPPEIIRNLGIPFFTTKENGTGLGLAISYRIIERHNGKISIDSGPLGTKVSITLPKG